MTTLIKLAGTIEDSAKTIRDREVFEVVAGEWDTFIRQLKDASKILKGLNESHSWLKTHNAGMSSFSRSVSQLTANLEKIREYLDDDDGDDARQQIQKVREILRDRVFLKVQERIENYKEFVNKEWKKYIEADSYPSADLYAPYKDHPEYGEIVGEYTRYLISYREVTLSCPVDEDQRTQFENLRTGIEELQGKLPEPPSELIQKFVEAASSPRMGVRLKTFSNNMDEIWQWLKDNNLTEEYLIWKKSS